ncbi:uncharacterized protein Z519_08767 [Cladophialophora bantiana CBS 173.52]|uniref:Major facilitator superfamily (MFS) profile domain-containing protein n=1 Tax=Cladophialophora bantiana (strain ATCC 10958 / CBS 173.52 / CDC B-1940 / NIH 8579) TaxID=1442370 RepID=A0A0D2I299_CLAB1|nr:uncharacterized protein Z519_08767 [Cladophialophora bantiana CBS 173.52]KIW90984.1 hypothetical protein Z519_08767 [Cladophialophora bantiana CBS 173.52]
MEALLDPPDPAAAPARDGHNASQTAWNQNVLRLEDEKHEQKGKASDKASLGAQQLEASSANVPMLQAPEVQPPPDGGFMAWLHVVLSHFVFFNTWGVTNSFGVFQQYYEQSLGHPPSDISWIGSVQVFLLFFVGVYAGRATDAGYFRHIFLSGVILQLMGTFLTSLCTDYWEIFLAQAICVGLGHGFVFSPAMSVLSSYFSTKRALAVGLAAVGGATGGIVYPAVANQLLYHSDIGFPWTIRIVGFIMLGTHMPSLLFFRPRLPPRKAGKLIEWAALRELPYTSFAAAFFFNFWGLYFVFFYLGTFARDKLGVTDSVNLVVALNGVGVIGRFLPNLVGVYYTGTLNILLPFTFTAALLVFCWIAVSSVKALWVFTAIYGIVAAGTQSLCLATATVMVTDLRKVGTQVGMVLTIVSFATLTGPAIQGALIQRDQGGYLYAQIFSATSILIGAVLAVVARISKAGSNLKVKI